ncbi:MAG: hypothetical protein AB1Y36_08245 [Cycloclasticus sp.]
MYKISFVFLLACIATSGSYAAEWSLTGSVNPSAEYDDNIFMRDENRQGDYHFQVSPTLVATRKQENSESSLSLGVSVDRYEASQQLDQENPFLRFNTQLQQERARWGLALSYVESSSRSDAADDTGDFETNSTLTTSSISPSFSYQLTERDTVSLNASYAEKESSTSDFSNSTNKSLSSSWQHQFSERLKGGVSLSASNNKSSSLSNLTDDNSYNLSLTSQYRFSEIWALNGNVGLRQLDSQQTNILGVTDNSSSTGTSLGFTVSYSGEVDSANLSLSRSISPSSTGEINEQEKVSLSWSRELSETLSSHINASFQTTSSALDEGADKRENINVSPSLRWALSPDTTLSLAYKYRQQKESNLGTRASSNAIMLTMSYDWHGFRIAR